MDNQTDTTEQHSQTHDLRTVSSTEDPRLWNSPPADGGDSSKGSRQNGGSETRKEPPHSTDFGTGYADGRSIIMADLLTDDESNNATTSGKHDRPQKPANVKIEEAFSRMLALMESQRRRDEDARDQMMMEISKRFTEIKSELEQARQSNEFEQKRRGQDEAAHDELEFRTPNGSSNLESSRNDGAGRQPVAIPPIVRQSNERAEPSNNLPNSQPNGRADHPSARMTDRPPTTNWPNDEDRRRSEYREFDGRPSGQPIHQNQAMPFDYGHQPMYGYHSPPSAPSDGRSALGNVLSSEAIGKSIVHGIPKYDGQNYEQWSDAMYQVLKLEGLLRHMEVDMPKERPHDLKVARDDFRMATFMRTHIDVRYKYLVESNGYNTTVFEIWSALLARHEHEHRLKVEESVMKLIQVGAEGPRNSLFKYLDLMMATVGDLHRRRATLDDIVTAIVLNGIPSKWTHLKSIVKNLDNTCEQKVIMIRQMYDTSSKYSQAPGVGRGPRVMNVDDPPRKVKSGRSQGQSASDSDGAVSERTKFKASKKPDGRAKKAACFSCGKTGHWKAACKFKNTIVAACDDCYEKCSSTESETDEEDDNAGAVFCLSSDSSGSEDVLNTVESECSDEELDLSDQWMTGHVVNQVAKTDAHRDRWIFDTGSSIHLANDLKWFTKHKPTSARFGTSDNSSTIRAEAVGTVRFRLKCGREFTVDRVFYCPSARMNLLSNQNLSDEFTFKVTPTLTTVNFRDSKTRRSQSFEFARVIKKQNVICVDQDYETVFATTTRRSRKQQDRFVSDEQSAPTKVVGAPASEQTVKKKPGRPRKQPPSGQRVESARRSSDEVKDSPEQSRVQPTGKTSDQESDEPYESARLETDLESNRESDLEERHRLASASEIDEDEDEQSALKRELYPPKLRAQMKLVARNNKIKDGRDVHKAHGHIGESATKRMAQLYDVPCPNFDCEPCRQFNLTHEVNRRISVRRSSRPLEIIYLDICQPYKRTQEAYNGVYLSLVILDDFTGYAQVYNIRRKSEAYSCFVHFMTKAERRHPNCKVNEIRTDNGREFNNDQFAALAEKLGFDHRFAVAHVHEMSGRVERLNRTLEERCHKLMEYSGLPLYYWPLAMKHAVQLFNSTANTRTGVPYFNWFNNADDRMPFDFGERVVFLYYDTSGVKQRANGRIVGHDDDSKSFKVIPQGSNEVKKRVYFVKPLHRYSDSSVEPIKLGDVHGQRMEKEAERFNEFAQAVFESRERGSPGHSADRLIDESTGEEEVAEDFVLQVSADDTPGSDGPIPTQYADLQRLPDDQRDYWTECVRKELSTLIEKGVFRPVRRSEAKTRPIGTRFVFTKKETGKARMVARGDRQDVRTYDETFSPTTNVEVLRVLLKIALEQDMEVYTFDVKRAYLNALLKEDVYIELPQGYHLVDPTLNRDEYVLKLERALYGLKQSGREWNLEITETLRRFGFAPLKREPTLFHHRQRGIYLAVYVDDLVVVAPKLSDVEFVRESLRKKYELHENGPIGRILGLNVEKVEDGYALHLQDMIEDLVGQYDIKPDERVRTPLSANELIEPHPDAVPVEYEEYAALIGSLLYIARMTRPDVLSAVVQLCQFQSAPKNPHMRRARRVLCYLARTKSRRLYVRRTGSLDLAVHSDSSLGNLYDRKSLMGVAVFLGGSLVGYSSKKSRLVTLSSNEAEIVAGLGAARDLLYFKRLMCELLHKSRTIGGDEGCSACTAPLLLVDNAGVISFVSKGFTRRTRYLDIEFYALKFYSDLKEYSLQQVRSESNGADMFTKSLGCDVLQTQCEIAGLK